MPRPSRPKTRSARVMIGPSQSEAARSTTLRSSRTLPGQSWPISADMASTAMLSGMPRRLRHLGEEVVHELRDVLAALAQRRELDVDDREAEVEVLAEGALVDHLAQVAVGGGEHAHVDLDDLVAADALDLAVLEHAQQLGLQVEVELADLVEEDGAALGLLEAAAAAGRPRR